MCSDVIIQVNMLLCNNYFYSKRDLMSSNISKENTQETLGEKKVIGIKAVYGIVQLKQVKFLVVATKSSLIGSIYNKHIFNLTEMEFFPITPK